MLEIMNNLDGSVIHVDDTPPSIRYAGWTVEELDKLIEEGEKNPPKTWDEAFAKIIRVE